MRAFHQPRILQRRISARYDRGYRAAYHQTPHLPRFMLIRNWIWRIVFPPERLVSWRERSRTRSGGSVQLNRPQILKFKLE
jgi:hypothetical protein